MDETEATALARCRKAALELANEPNRSQRRQTVPHLERDMARKARGELSSCTMRISRIRAALAARASPSSSPARGLAKTKSELTIATSHRD